ncbi:MAG: pyridoxamine 5'-phosphate oxidase [Chitinophagia bacterium]|nr:pyridoxamine 5'-phosphate oxidase [Chitinophagia bacterium]
MADHSLNPADIRQDYTLGALDEQTTGDDPVVFFREWFRQAMECQITEVNAMTLATCSSDGRPHARTVLLKGIEHAGFAFYTNYNSAKGNEIAANSHVALLFFWKELERQVRVEGTVIQLPAEESDAYFNSRPEGSKIGAWASPQSQVITTREILEANVARYSQQFAGTTIPRPAHWGGYLVIPKSIEFWQGRSSRLHDRILFTRNANGGWDKCRLAP